VATTLSGVTQADKTGWCVGFGLTCQPIRVNPNSTCLAKQVKCV
jgi:hypothetical protein